MSLRDALPEASVLELASKCEIEDDKGNKVLFGSLFADQKTVVVFIRHFFCGMCQLFVEQLAAVPEAALEAAGAQIVVVGCGDFRGLENYRENTGFKGPIYVDSTRKLYFTLGMDIQTMATAPSGQKPSYVTEGSLSNAWKSIKNGPLKDPSLLGKQGNFGQIGGDWVFGPGNQCTFAHRMQNTQDHVEVKVLMKAASVILP
ncbi:AhpC/TSA antioxidant enzyme-domain-containing protein [Mycena albidolilacea]|uniref:AhpC/TSA antioxidant enzyme-domain-containing protein n=1 Tax=Mycena albidolilacea TaxID=1033008 RepID=A0AAD7A6J4_9AGAR|nr:AhpC/TSA antioxidant enzyme-domain-containing protein [Mycena albidolilacea]